MIFSSLASRPQDYPVRALLTLFLVWKTILLLLALSSPGPGYDTSTALLLHLPDTHDTHLGLIAGLLTSISQKLTRWDGIYYATTARRDYLYEQEWAFGWGFTRMIKTIASALKLAGVEDFDSLESIVGVLIAHASHALSALVVYVLVRAVFVIPSSRKLAFMTACLYILSPAGLFLSAPFSESTFAFLNLLGCLLFVWSVARKGKASFAQDLLLIPAGLVFGISTTVRSNGLLSGIIFLEETLKCLYDLRHGPKFSALRRLVAAVLGGMSIALLFLLPQYIAYVEYCGSSVQYLDRSSRIWCRRTIPSIYTFVQAHYWNVGFLRYWTLSNIPLFLLAAPMLVVLVLSSLWAFKVEPDLSSAEPNQRVYPSKDDTTVLVVNDTSRLLRTLAVPQFVLAILALTSYHVQIINRISSGYIVWYIWLATTLSKQSRNESTNSVIKEGNRGISGQMIVRYIIMYAFLQGGLFSSFLPPA